jgi:hypothetical protein
MRSYFRTTRVRYYLARAREPARSPGRVAFTLAYKVGAFVELWVRFPAGRKSEWRAACHILINASLTRPVPTAEPKCSPQFIAFRRGDESKGTVRSFIGEQSRLGTNSRPVNET